MNLPNNTLLQGGKYKIVRFISSGGFGCTYEGVHVMLKKRVAIKEFFVKDFCNRNKNTLHVSVGTQNKMPLVVRILKKFIDEAIALSQLSHPNIVKVSDVFEENGTAYYVMDYIDGMSLADMLNNKGALPESKATEYILQIADALRFVHSNNRLHLDIKPGNIMVDKKDNIFLIDFGASKQYDEDGENTSTLLGLNTIGYAPPEQMSRSFTEFNPAADVYALGATYLKLITNTKFLPDSVLLLSGDMELPKLPATISKNVRDAIAKAMEPRRRNRIQTIDEFLKVLGKPASKKANKTNSAKKATKVDDEETEIDLSAHDADSLYRRGEECLKKRYLHAKDYQEAERWIHKAANMGHAKAMLLMGKMYLEGKGVVVKDEVRAANWFLLSAEQGEAEAQRYIAAMYARGIGVEQNDAKAQYWYNKSNQ